MAELVQLRVGRSGPSRTFALFDLGMRPFFLAAGLTASLSLLWWLLVYAGVIAPSMQRAALWHHAHEMCFGFGSAAVAGFLLTATANWTNTRPVQGAPLALLFALWLLGRVAFHLQGLHVWLVAVLDCSFLPALAMALWPALRRGKLKNFTFEAWILVLAFANVFYHLEALGLVAGVTASALNAGVYSLVMLVVILSGRVVPGFTQNALRLREKPCETHTHPIVELAAKAVCLGALSSDVISAPHVLTGLLALLAASLLLLRMRYWRSLQVYDQPIVWILHVAHLWVVLGMLLLGLQRVGLLLLPGVALHAFTAGAVGSMVLAIMTRAALGHTGRPLRATWRIVVAYWLVTLGAAMRVFGPLFAPSIYRASILFGGSAWALAYVLFTWVYTPILLRPRADGL